MSNKRHFHTAQKNEFSNANTAIQRGRLRKVRGIVAISSFLALLLSSLITFTYRSSGIDSPTVSMLTAIAAVSIGLHLFFTRQKNWLRIDTLFLLSLFIVNFQWPIMYAIFEYVPPYGHVSRSIDTYGNQAVFYATISMICWSLGFFLIPRTKKKSQLNFIRGQKVLPPLLFVAIILFSALAGPKFFTRSIYTNGYVATGQTVGASAAYALDVLEMLVRLSLSLLAYQTFVVRQKISVLAMPTKSSVSLIFGILAFCIVLLIGGERGQVVSVILGVMVAQGKLGKPIRPVQFLVVVLTGFTLFTLLGILRSGAPNISEALGRYGLFAITQSLAQSVSTLTQAIGMSGTPEQPEVGQVWLSQILGVVPFLQSVAVNLFGMDAVQSNSALAITVYTFGPDAQTSLGTSFVADLYLAFGIPGVVLGSMAFGALSFRMDEYLSGRHGFYAFNIALIFASLIFYIGRSSALFQLKSIVWGAIAAKVLLKIYQSRKSLVFVEPRINGDEK